MSITVISLFDVGKYKMYVNIISWFKFVTLQFLFYYEEQLNYINQAEIKSHYYQILLIEISFSHIHILKQNDGKHIYNTFI
jgi:hypothetical protein